MTRAELELYEQAARGAAHRLETAKRFLAAGVGSRRVSGTRATKTKERDIYRDIPDPWRVNEEPGSRATKQAKSDSSDVYRNPPDPWRIDEPGAAR